MTLFASRPKRDLLLCVARHMGRHTSSQYAISKAQGPGLSVSNREPLGIFSFSRFCATSSRSLGRCLLLGQRSRTNLFSNNVRPLIFQDRINPRTQFPRHPDDGDPGSFATWISPANGTIKFSKLRVLADRRPGSLNQLASKPPVSHTGNRSSINRIARGVLSRHQAQEATQLSNIVDLAPVSNAGQKLAPHNPADPGDAPQVFNRPRQFRIFFTETANLFGSVHDLLFTKFQIVEQLIEFKTHDPRTRKLSELVLDHERPLTPGRGWGKADAFEQQQGFDSLLVRRRLPDQRIAQLREMAKLAINGRGNMNAFELSSTQALGQPSTVESIRFYSLSWRSGNHRGRGDQALITLSRKPIIQPVSSRSSLIDKGDLLIPKMLAHVIQQVLYAIRHLQRTDESLLIAKRCRDTFFIHIQPGKHIVISGYERLASHLSTSLAQWLWFAPLYQSTRSEERHPSYKSQSPRYNVLAKYASAPRFFARLASEIFLSSLQLRFFSNPVG